MSEEYSLEELEDLAKSNWKKMTPYVMWHIPIAYLTFSIYVNFGLDVVEELYNPWPPYRFLFILIALSFIGFFRKKPVLILKFPVSLQAYIKIYLLRVYAIIVWGGSAAAAIWFSTVREVFTPESINLYSKTFGYFQVYLAIPIGVIFSVMVFFSSSIYAKK